MTSDNERTEGYILVRSDSFWDVFDTYEEAEKEAEYLWDHKTDGEKDDTEIFQISKCDNLVDGMPPDDWNFDENCERDFVREWQDAPRTMEVFFSHGNRVYKAEVRNDDDVWKAISEFDREMYEELTEDDVLGVNLDAEYPNAQRVDSWGDVEEDEDDRIQEVTVDLKISAYGHSLVLRVTDPAKILGVDRGDIVQVTIRRK